MKKESRRGREEYGEGRRGEEREKWRGGKMEDRRKWRGRIMIRTGIWNRNRDRNRNWK